MHDVVLAHVVQRNEDLDGEALDQTQRKAQEIVHLDEVVEVDTEQFKGEDEMLAEDEVIQALHNVLLILWVVTIQSLNQL